MTFLGEKNSDYETAIFITLSVISFFLIILQVLFLQKLKSLSVRMLPLLTLLVCFENACSAAGDKISSDSIFADFSVVLISAILPFFLIVLFELPFRLHEARSAHFMCIPFEQGEGLSRFIASASLNFMRCTAVALFVINMLVNLDLLHDENSRAGLGGYANADEEIESTHFWLSLVPSMVIAALSLFISVLMQRYRRPVLSCFCVCFSRVFVYIYCVVWLITLNVGCVCRYARNFTLGIRNSNHYWRYMLPCSVMFAAGQSFGSHIYRWTSLMGDVFLVIGISIMVHRVQSDLAVAGSFADFLHRSNTVFRSSQSREDLSAYKGHAVGTSSSAVLAIRTEEVDLEASEGEGGLGSAEMAMVKRVDRSVVVASTDDFEEEEVELHAL